MNLVGKCSQCGNVGKDDPCNYCVENPPLTLQEMREALDAALDRIEILERRLDPCEACEHVHPPDRRCVFARAAYEGRVEECGCEA